MTSLHSRLLIRSFDKNVKECSAEDMHPKLIRIFKVFGFSTMAIAFKSLDSVCQY